ncbi:Ig-like domain-containing protein [Paenibacillus elgii]
MFTRSNKLYWKKQLMVMLGFAVVVSGLPAVFAPQTVNAVGVVPAPGGVDVGLISWVDGEKSINITDRTENMIVTSLADLREGRTWNGGGKYLTNAVNFNGGLQFPGPGLYQITHFETTDSAREIYSVQVNEASPSVTDKSFPWEFGSGISTQPSTFYGPTIRTVFGRESRLDINVDNDLKNATMMNIWSAPNDWRLSLNGVKKHSESSNTPNFTSRTSPKPYYYIGAGHNSVFNGRISEVILYNRKLESVERQKVNSYLALKYGLTLKDEDGQPTDYVDSIGNSMWSKQDIGDYTYRITGIGKDTASGLEQRQSKSVDSGALVTIALGNELAPSNAKATPFPADVDKTFLTFSDNNNSTDYQLSNNEEPRTGHKLKKMDRVFKTQKSGNWPGGNVTLKLEVTPDTDAPVYNYYLLTSSDGVTFNNPSVDLKLNDKNEVTLNSENLQYFTFAKVYKEDLKTLVEGLLPYEAEHYTADSWNAFDTSKTKAEEILAKGDASQEEVDNAHDALQTGIKGLTLKTPKTAILDVAAKTITIPFNYDATLSASKDGFILKIDGQEPAVDISNITFDPASKSLTIALPANISLNEDSKVTVDYQATNENVKGPYDKAVKDFTLVAETPFAAALTIAQPAGSIVSAPQPLISGKVEPNSTVNIVIKGKDGNPVAGAGGTATVDAQGNWTYTPGVVLPNGVYKIEATATKPGQTVTKTKDLGIVDKSTLQAKVTDAGSLHEVDYIPDSWAALQTQLTAAQAVLNNTNAMPDDVANALDALTTAINNLVKKSSKLVTAALSGKEVTLTFDRDVTVNNLNGLTVTVGGQAVTLTPANVQADPADPTKVIVTLPQNPNGSQVLVSYQPADPATGGLQGTNGKPVESFASVEAIDPFTAAFIIKQPAGTVVPVSQLTISGKVESGSSVDIVINDKNGNPVANAGGSAIVDGSGNWSFATPIVLANGDYTIVATATKSGGKSAVRTKAITVNEGAPAVSITEPSSSRVSVAKPEFKGTADAGSTVTVAIKDKHGNVVGTPTVTVNAYGAWNFTPDSDLVDGNYTFEVTATKDGKSTQVAKTVAVDTSLPALTITEPSGNTVSVSKPEFKGTADAGSTVTVTIKDKDGNIVGTPTVTVNVYGAWSFTPDHELADGNYTIEVTSTKDGKSTQVTKTVTVAATTNESKLTGLQLKSWYGTPIVVSPAFNGSTTKYAASVTNNVYSMTVSPTALEPGAKIEVSVNNGPWQQVANGAASGNLPLNVGMNTIVVKVTDAKGHVTEYTLTITRESSDSGDSDSSSGGSTTTPSTSTGSSSSGASTTPNGSGIETSVNGKDDTFATGKESTSGDRKVTSVQVDLDKLNKALSQGNGQKLAIRSSKDGDMKVNGLTAGAVKQLADKGTSLEISNPLAIYPVPGGKMDLSAVSKQLGNAALGDIAVHIDIARASDTLINNAKNKATAEGYELLVTPVDLDMTFSHDGKMVRVGQLNGYAEKYIALPEGIDPNRITTGVIINPDGSVFHVPTVVTKINSRYYALIKDLRSQGSYSVIWNPQDFDDVKSHWGKTDVNNIAARLDLAGTGNNTFTPDRNVTRSEFSEIVVAGLGLKRQNAPQNKFPDVSDSAWYRSSVAIANEFDIVRGYEDGSFYGDRQITREQGMAMIARAYKLIETKAALSQEQTDSLLAKYEDAKKVSAWAREDIALMIEAGIVQGNGPQLLSPQSNMTRAEVTALIARLLKTTNLIDK